MRPPAANRPYRLPPPLFDARCRACWLAAGVLLLVVASFASLDMHWGAFLSVDALASMGRFLGEFAPPELGASFVRSVVVAAWETLAMSALGTLLAATAGVLLALPVGCTTRTGRPAVRRRGCCSTRCVPCLNWCGRRCC
jgi:phosphonate transport system permease protein